MPEQSFLAKVRQLRPLPAAAQQLLSMSCDERVGVADIAEVIALDPALTTKILQISNSAFYGLSRRLSTVEEAAVILGVHGIRNLALGVSLIGKAGASPALSRLWQHSLAVGVAARLIAKRVGGPHVEIAFTAGLIHDIGRSAFLEIYGEGYLEAVERSSEGHEPSLLSLEREAYGLDHAQAGEAICKHWKIPPTLSQVVARHHSVLAPSGSGERLERVVRLADVLANLTCLTLETDVWVSADDLSHIEALGLRPGPDLWNLMLQIPREVTALTELFGLQSDCQPKEPEDAGAVGLLASTPREVFLLGLALAAMGYSPQQLQGANAAAVRIAAISVAGSNELVRKIESSGVRVLDVRAWRLSHAIATATLPVPRFRRWVSESAGEAQSNAA